MAIRVDQIEFVPEATAAIAEVMDELAATNSGWITVDPAILDEHTPPTQSAFGRMIGNRGPYVPRGTWVPADTDRRRPEPMSIGILHAQGPKAIDRLAGADVELPTRWRAVSDHPKRGIVVYVPIDVPHVEVIDWLLRSVTVLTRVPLTGQWRASIHRP